MIKLAKLLSEVKTTRDGEIDLSKIARINFTYTEGSRHFYGAYLYDTPKDPHAGSYNWKYKISYEDEIDKMLIELGVDEKLPHRFDTAKLEEICQLITSNTGIAADYDDSMDVS